MNDDVATILKEPIVKPVSSPPNETSASESFGNSYNDTLSSPPQQFSELENEFPGITKAKDLTVRALEAGKRYWNGEVENFRTSKESFPKEAIDEFGNVLPLVKTTIDSVKGYGKGVLRLLTGVTTGSVEWMMRGKRYVASQTGDTKEVAELDSAIEFLDVIQGEIGEMLKRDDTVPFSEIPDISGEYFTTFGLASLATLKALPVAFVKSSPYLASIASGLFPDVVITTARFPTFKDQSAERYATELLFAAGGELAFAGLFKFAKYIKTPLAKEEFMKLSVEAQKEYSERALKEISIGRENDMKKVEFESNKIKNNEDLSNQAESVQTQMDLPAKIEKEGASIQEVSDASAKTPLIEDTKKPLNEESVEVAMKEGVGTRKTKTQSIIDNELFPSKKKVLVQEMTVIKDRLREFGKGFKVGVKNTVEDISRKQKELLEIIKKADITDGNKREISQIINSLNVTGIKTQKQFDKKIAQTIRNVNSVIYRTKKNGLVAAINKGINAVKTKGKRLKAGVVDNYSYADAVKVIDKLKRVKTDDGLALYYDAVVKMRSGEKLSQSDLDIIKYSDFIGFKNKTNAELEDLLLKTEEVREAGMESLLKKQEEVQVEKDNFFKSLDDDSSKIRKPLETRVEKGGSTAADELPVKSKSLIARFKMQFGAVNIGEKIGALVGEVDKYRQVFKNLEFETQRAKIATDKSVNALKVKIKELIGGRKASKQFFNQKLDVRLDRINEDGSVSTIFLTDKNGEKATKSTLLHFYLMMKRKSVKNELVEKYSEESIEKALSYLSVDEKKLGDFMSSEFKTREAAFNQSNLNTNGVNIKFEDSYFPSERKGVKEKGRTDFKNLEIQFAGRRERTGGEGELVFGDAVDIFNRNIQNEDMVIHLDEDLMKANSMFDDKRISKKLNDLAGDKTFTEGLKDDLERFSGQRKPVSGQDGLLDIIRINFVKNKIFRPATYLKQLSSIGGYLHDMSGVDYVKYLADSRKFSAMRDIANSAQAKLRYANGLDIDLQPGALGKYSDSDLLRAIDQRTFFTRAGDKTAIVTGGYPKYLQVLDETKKANPSLGEKETRELAMEEFWSFTDRHQQSSGALNQSNYQSGGSANRFITMFSTSQHQGLNKMILDAQAVSRKPSKKNIIKLSKTIAVNFTMNASFGLMGSFLANGGTLDKDDVADAAKYGLLGPITGYHGYPGLIAKALQSYMTTDKVLNSSIMGEVIDSTMGFLKDMSEKGVQRGDWEGVFKSRNFTDTVEAVLPVPLSEMYELGGAVTGAYEDNNLFRFFQTGLQTENEERNKVAFTAINGNNEQFEGGVLSLVADGLETNLKMARKNSFYRGIGIEKTITTNPKIRDISALRGFRESTSKERWQKFLDAHGESEAVDLDTISDGTIKISVITDRFKEAKSSKKEEAEATQEFAKELLNEGTATDKILDEYGYGEEEAGTDELLDKYGY